MRLNYDNTSFYSSFILTTFYANLLQLVKPKVYL